MQKLKLDNEKISDVQWLYSQNWEYHDYGNCKRHLQILFPYKRNWSGDEKLPLILFIPGSAWHKQEMYNDIPQYAKLAERGFVVAAMEYRESDIAPFPAQVEDVCNALKFIPSIAENFHIDRNRIFLMGNSSGGHIAMMSVLFSAHGLCEKLPKLSGVILESASTDLLICSKNPLPPWMQVRPSAVLLLHSEFDPVVSVENSRVLYEKLVENGHEVVYYELEGLDDHGGAVFYSAEVLSVVKAFCENSRQ